MHSDSISMLHTAPSGSISSLYSLDHHHHVQHTHLSSNIDSILDRTLYNGGEFNQFQMILTNYDDIDQSPSSSSFDFYNLLLYTIRYLGPQRALLYLFTTSGNLVFNNEDVYGVLQSHQIEV
jgi:hypothetical protein